MTPEEKEDWRLMAWGTDRVAWLQKHGLDARKVASYSINRDCGIVIAERPEIGDVSVPLIEEPPVCQHCMTALTKAELTDAGGT